jgi:hypothetical protein
MTIRLRYIVTSPVTELNDVTIRNLRPRLNETGTKSNRDHFVSVIILFIIDVYMRPGRK